jgi:hypothetical protein
MPIMNGKQRLSSCAALAALLAATAANAAVRSSPGYLMETDTYDAGGMLCALAGSHKMESSLGGGTAHGRPKSLTHFLRSGFVAQLYEFVGLSITSAGNPNEQQPVQLYATALTNSGDQLQGLEGVVSWIPPAWPLAFIQPSGLAWTQSVYQNTQGTASAVWRGVVGSGTFWVINNNADNYMSYGADGLPDDWQIDHFGLPPNSDAGPAQNPDHDPDPNEDEWMTGHDPNDPADFFRFVITGRNGTTATFELDQVIPGRVYLLKGNDDLDASWSTIAIEEPGALIHDYVMQDTAATEDREFYKVIVVLSPE